MKEPTIAAHVMADIYFQKEEKRRMADIQDLRRFVPYFLKHPGPVIAMDFRDYKREHPDFPCRDLRYLKGKRTLLRKKGMIP